MSLINITGARKDFGIKTLFKDLNLQIKSKDRLGLIGPNGAGKSTLLKVLAGTETLEEGTRFCPQRLHIEHVDQESSLVRGHTVLQEVLAGCGDKRKLLIRFQELSESIARKPNEQNLLAKLSQLTQAMDEAQAWGLEQQCKEVLNRLGITDLQRNVEELSGGYRKRVSLASALVSKPDVLLLDEPTNHLDAKAVEWLQNWLDQFNGALVIVTHDRYLLDRITHNMLEVDKGEAFFYQGNYSDFLSQKTQKAEIEAANTRKFKNILKKELAWLKRGAKARSTKQKARIQRIEGMQSKQIDKTISHLEISSLSKRIGKVVIEAEGLHMTSNGEAHFPIVFENFSYSFTPEDRVGIIGPNGCGKSTLLDLIAGRRKATAGKLRLGETVRLGYLDQHTMDFTKGQKLEKKVIDFVEEVASRIDLNGSQISASQLLERFLFPPAQQHSPLKKLSGGERRRLALCKILIQAPNVLLLDEPTNDLDLTTLRVLEEFLESFQGCVIVVSHDRYFLDRVVNRLFNFENGNLNQFEGNYSDFLDQKKLLDKEIKNYSASKKENRNLQTSNSKASTLKHEDKPLYKASKSKNRKLSFKESRELEKLEKDLPLLEKKRFDIEQALLQKDADLTNLSKELAELVERITLSEDRWLELSELLP